MIQPSHISRLELTHILNAMHNLTHCPTKTAVPPAFLFLFVCFLSQNIPPVPFPITAVIDFLCLLSYGVSLGRSFVMITPGFSSLRPSAEFSTHSLFGIHWAMCFSAPAPRWLCAEGRRHTPTAQVRFPTLASFSALL